MIKRNRVVVTGMGVLAPNGIGLEAFWESLLAGRSGIGPITLFDASNFKSRIAGEVKNFDPNEYIEAELKPKRMARHTQLAYAATTMALKDAGLDINNLDLPSPTPVVIGVSTSALDVIERVFHQVNGPGPDRVSPLSLGASKPQAVANVVADKIGTCANASTGRDFASMASKRSSPGVKVHRLLRLSGTCKLNPSSFRSFSGRNLAICHWPQSI